MTQGDRVENESAGAQAARVVGHGLWILLPIFSLSFLAWLPATQTWWRARTLGWLMTSIGLVLACTGIITGMAVGAGGAGLGLLLIGTMLGGTVAAAMGRPVFFGRRPAVAHRAAAHGPPVPGPADPRRIVADPAVQAVLYRRDRRNQAREIVVRDPAMAFELRIGRPDLPRHYDDGGLVDLNNVTADGLATALNWDREVAEVFASGRDIRGGYASMDELAALSGVEPSLLEHDAERLVVLPHRPA